MEKKTTIAIIAISVLIIIATSSYMLIKVNDSADLEVHNEIERLEVSDEILVLNGWVGVNELPIMSEPSESGDIIGTLSFNEEIEYTIYNGNWLKVENRNVCSYVSSKDILSENTGYASYDQYVLEKIIGYTLYDVPTTSGFKSYMDYRSITSTDSRQYKLQNRYAETGEYGIRMVDGRYCVAIGSHFTSDIGQYFDLILENGTVIPCVMSDQKADKHTDSNNIVTMHNGCMSEFIVDTNSLSDSAKNRGNISYCNDSWNSKVVQVRVYNKNVFGD